MPIKTSEKVKASRKKSHGAPMLDLCRIFHYAWFRWYDSAAIPDWLWRRSKSDCFRRSLPIRTSEIINAKDSISPFWALRMSGLNLENSHGAFKLDFWKASRFRHRTSDWLWRRSSATVWEGYISPPTRSMPIRTSEKVKTSRKSHTVLSCLTSAESFITPDFVGTIPLDSVRFRRLHPTDSTTIFDQADDYQEKASLSVSEQVPHEKSRSSSRKSASGTVPTVFGSSAGHSFGKPQRDCVSETSLLSQLAGPGGGLESRSVSTKDESLMTGKRDRGESVGQSMRDRENLHIILERERLSHQFKGRMKLRKIIRDWSWCGN